MSHECLPIFVYGTLQRGEQRESCWPHKPTRIEWATVTGRLYDLTAYPALVEGEDLVLGELWHVAERDLDATLKTLDEIEGFAAGDPDSLYLRTVVTSRTLAGESRRAFTYVYARPDRLARAPTVLADRDGFCHWTTRGAE